MSRLTHRFTHLTLSFALTALVALGTALPAFADDSVLLSIGAGGRSASVADMALDTVPVQYAHTAQTRTGTMTLTADDSTGSALGWKVNVSASDFVFTDSATDRHWDIGAANFSITAANAPAMTAGQAIDATNGPKVPSDFSSGSLESAHKVIQANADYGKGTYTQDLDVSLNIPADSRAGAYAATLTVTIAAAP